MSDQLHDLIADALTFNEARRAARGGQWSLNDECANIANETPIPWLPSAPTLADCVALWEAVHGATVREQHFRIGAPSEWVRVPGDHPEVNLAGDLLRGLRAVRAS